MTEVSVVIPTHNRASRLEACLECLNAQTGDVSFDVVVVDDGSTDGTPSRVAALSSDRVRVVSQPQIGAAAARNRGAEEAAGTYVLFLDDDVLAEPGLVAAHLAVQQSGEKIAGLGRLVLDFDRRPSGFARYFSQKRAEHFRGLERGERVPEWRHCYGGNLSVPRALFVEVGGFAADLPRAHDIELGYRLARSGARFVYVANATGREVSRRGFIEIARHFDREGAAGVELYRRHPPMIEKLELGGPVPTSVRSFLLRRALLALGRPMRALAVVEPLIPGKERKERWYAFLVTYCYWRGVRSVVEDRETWKRLNSRTAILLYHALAVEGESSSRFVVSAVEFRRQMAWLDRRGYTVLSLRDYVDCRRRHALPPARSVVITFDDGYADNISEALPVLAARRFTAAFFLVSRAVGNEAGWNTDPETATPLARRRLLTWSDARTLVKRRFEIGAHTRTHPRLTSVDRETAASEIEGSRADIERELANDVTAFAYPYGDYDERVRELVEEVGFLGACTTSFGLNDAKTPVHALRRMEVQGGDSLLQFALGLWSGNLWLVNRARRLGERRRR